MAKPPRFKIGERVYLVDCGEGTILQYNREAETCYVYFDSATRMDAQLGAYYLTIDTRRIIILGQYLSVEEMLTHPCDSLRKHAIEQMKLPNK